MTPGQEALREAARLEAALVYGRVVKEYKQPPSVLVAAAEAMLEDVDDLEIAKRRKIARGAA